MADDKPPEGSTPEQITEFYRQREERIIAEANRRIMAANTRPPDPPPPANAQADLTDADFMNRPLDSASRIVKDATKGLVQREEFDRVVAESQGALASAARLMVKQRHPDFDDFSAEIEKQMEKVAPSFKVREDYWETAYFIAKGLASDRLVEQAKVRPPDRPAADASGGGGKPPERTLSAEEVGVGEMFGYTPEEYKANVQRYEEKGGLLPFTYDSRRKRGA